MHRKCGEDFFVAFPPLLGSVSLSVSLCVSVWLILINPALFKFQCIWECSRNCPLCKDWFDFLKSYLLQGAVLLHFTPAKLHWKHRMLFTT